MKHELCAADLLRLPFDVRVYIDHHLDRGAKLEAISARRCRRDLKAARLSTWRMAFRGVSLDPPGLRTQIRRSGKPDFRGLDEWDGRTQGNIPEHYEPSRYFDLGSANALFREMYSADRLENLAYEETPFMRMLPR